MSPCASSVLSIVEDNSWSKWRTGADSPGSHMQISLAALLGAQVQVCSAARFGAQVRAILAHRCGPPWHTGAGHLGAQVRAILAHRCGPSWHTGAGHLGAQVHIRWTDLFDTQVWTLQA